MDKVLPTVWRYRWELLPLVVAFALGNLWRLQSWFIPGPGFWGTEAHMESIRTFQMLSHLAAAVVLGIGLVWALWKGQVMLPALWAIVFVRPMHLLVVYLDGMYLGWIHRVVEAVPANVFAQLLANVVLQLPAVLLAAFFAWRLSDLGVRHALLIAGGYLAWVWTPFTIPWGLSPFATGFELVVAWAGLALWLGMIGGLAFAFRHFPEWDVERQRIAVVGLVATPVAAVILQVLPGIVTHWPRVLDSWLLLPMVSGALVLGLTWVLALVWPVGRDTEAARPGE